MKKIKVYLWDNDPTMQEYKVGTFKASYIISNRMINRIVYEAWRKNVRFTFTDIVDAYVDCVLNGFGQAISTNCNVFLQMEVVDGD